MKRTSDEGGYVSKTGSPRGTGQVREQRVQTISGAPVPAQGGPSLNVAQLHLQNLFSMDDLPQVGAATNSGSSGLAVPADGAPQLLTPSVRVMPPGWTTTPPQWCTMTARRNPLWIDDALARARPAQQRVESSEKSLSEDDSIESEASKLTEDDLMQAWNDRQTLIANWKNQPWTCALPGEVMDLILRKALEVDDPDDVRPELTFLRNLGLVCKALALMAEALRTDQGIELSELRRAAAAYESKLLDKFYKFEMPFKKDFLRKRWGFPAALENRPEMARFGEFLYSHEGGGTIRWIDPNEYRAPHSKSGFGRQGFTSTDSYSFTLGEFTSEPSRRTWMEFVKQHGDQITSLCIDSHVARDRELFEQFRHCRKLSCLEVYGGEAVGIDLNWLADLAELKTLDVSSSKNPLVPASTLARLRELAVDSNTLHFWQELGVRASNWTAMEYLNINYVGEDVSLLELPPNLLRFKSNLWLPDDPAFPQGLTALNLVDFDKSPMSISKISKLNALTELRFLPRGGKDGLGLDLADAMAFANFLKSGRHRLRVLVLDLVDDLDVTNEVLSALKSFHSLEQLALREVPRDAEVVAALAEVITRQTHLRELKLNFKSLYLPASDDRKFAPFQLAIAQSASLRRVRVSFCRDKGGKCNPDGLDLMRGMDALLKKNRNLLEMRVLPTSGDWEYADLWRNWLLRPDPRPSGTVNS